MNKKYNKKTVLVTGASGFVGRNLLVSLLGEGAEVSIVSRLPASNLDVSKQYIGNISDKQFINNVVQDCNPQIIFHLAGVRNRMLDRAAFDSAIEVNLAGTLNVLFASMDLPHLERIVVLGSGEEYGRNQTPYSEAMRESPISAYSFSKQCATHLAQLMYVSFGIPVVIIRPSIVYGPFQQIDMFLPALIQSLLRGEVFKMTSGVQTRDYVYVMDLVDALLSAGVGSKINGEIVNIGSGAAVKIMHLAERVESMLGVTQLVQRGALDYRASEPLDYSFDIKKAYRLLNWKPRTCLADGLQQTINYFKSLEANR